MKVEKEQVVNLLLKFPCVHFRQNLLFLTYNPTVAFSFSFKTGSDIIEGNLHFLQIHLPPNSKLAAWFCP